MMVEEDVISNSDNKLEKSDIVDDFIIRSESEPHAIRRKLILAKHPEIKSLFGPESRTKYIVILLVALQLFLVSMMHHVNIIPFLLVTYFIGATVNHMLFVLIHDITHNLAFEKTVYNNILALIANLPIAIGFKRYHIVVQSHQETYSYYGPLNKIIFNVGMHNEHHDFPYVPWPRLKKISEIAPEFYKDLYVHKSLIGLMLRFLFDRNMTLYSRVVKR